MWQNNWNPKEFKKNIKETREDIRQIISSKDSCDTKSEKIQSTFKNKLWKDELWEMPIITKYGVEFLDKNLETEYFDNPEEVAKYIETQTGFRMFANHVKEK